jgi:CarD family transcriptional regulator
MPRPSVRSAARAPSARPTATKAAKKAPLRKPAAPVARTRPLRRAPEAAKSAAKVEAVVAKPASPEPPKAASPSVAPGPRPMMGPNGRPRHLLTTPPPPMPSDGKPVNFKIGDKAVHPAHGVGEVTAIEHRELGGTKGMFYILKILDNGMKVMVPTTAAQQAGLRGIMSGKEADSVLDTMRAREVAVDLQPWSRRFRAYTEMIKSGSPHEVAKVLRDMHRLKFDKDLSFGERRLLDQAKSLLMKELAFAKKLTEAQLAQTIADIFRA